MLCREGINYRKIGRNTSSGKQFASKDNGKSNVVLVTFIFVLTGSIDGRS